MDAAVVSEDSDCVLGARQLSGRATSPTRTRARSGSLRQNRPGESLTVDLGRAYDVKAIQVNYADYKSGLYGTDSTVVHAVPPARLCATARNGRRSPIFRASDATVPTRTSSSPTPMRARFVRYEHIHVGAANLAISDIRVFGNGAGPRPATPPA